LQDVFEDVFLWFDFGCRNLNIHYT
jgi:hypothetical protein